MGDLDYDPLELSLSIPSTTLPRPPSESSSSPSAAPLSSQFPTVRTRHGRSRGPREGKGEYIHPPYIWATNHRATVHSLNYLIMANIHAVAGNVKCKRCGKEFVIEYDLRSKFAEVGMYITENKHHMHDRATEEWMKPNLADCQLCAEKKCVKPVIASKKREVNWLFLFLGQTLGFCTLDKLKYFCKHTGNHRTGAKYRVLYRTYLALFQQLNGQ